MTKEHHSSTMKDEHNQTGSLERTSSYSDPNAILRIMSILLILEDTLIDIERKDPDFPGFVDWAQAMARSALLKSKELNALVYQDASRDHGSSK